MNRFRRAMIVGMALAVLVPSTLSGAAVAQGPNPFPAFDSLTGLEHAVARSYAMDFDALMEAAATAEEGDAAYRDVIALTGFVLEFDSEENAQAGYTEFMTLGIDTLLPILNFENPDVTESEVKGLGDQAYAYSIFNDTGETSGYFRYTIAQQGSNIFASAIVTELEETSLDGDALLAFMADASTQEASGMGTFDAAGGSTGGLWDLFPPAEHDLWLELIPDGDEVMFPAS